LGRKIREGKRVKALQEKLRDYLNEKYKSEKRARGEKQVDFRIKNLHFSEKNKKGKVGLKLFLLQELGLGLAGLQMCIQLILGFESSSAVGTLELLRC
jgi:hypothetical protein